MRVANDPGRNKANARLWQHAPCEKAEKPFFEAVEYRRLKLGDTHSYTKKSLNDPSALREAWGMPEKAQEWRAELRQTEAARE